MTKISKINVKGTTYEISDSAALTSISAVGTPSDSAYVSKIGINDTHKHKIDVTYTPIPSVIVTNGDAAPGQYISSITPNNHGISIGKTDLPGISINPLGVSADNKIVSKIAANPSDKHKIDVTYTDYYKLATEVDKPEGPAASPQVGTKNVAARADHVHPEQTTVKTANKVSNALTIKYPSNSGGVETLVYDGSSAEVISLSGDGGQGSLIGKTSIGYNSEIFNDYENNAVTADYGHAEGYNTHVNGEFGHAEGFNTVAFGACSHAEGSAESIILSNYGVISVMNENDVYNPEQNKVMISSWNSELDKIKPGQVYIASNVYPDQINTAMYAPTLPVKFKSIDKSSLILTLETHASEAKRIFATGLPVFLYDAAALGPGNIADRGCHVEGINHATRGRGNHASGFNTNINGTYNHSFGFGGYTNAAKYNKSTYDNGVANTFSTKYVNKFIKATDRNVLLSANNVSNLQLSTIHPGDTFEFWDGDNNKCLFSATILTVDFVLWTTCNKLVVSVNLDSEVRDNYLLIQQPTSHYCKIISPVRISGDSNSVIGSNSVVIGQYNTISGDSNNVYGNNNFIGNTGNNIFCSNSSVAVGTNGYIYANNCFSASINTLSNPAVSSTLFYNGDQVIYDQPMFAEISGSNSITLKLAEINSTWSKHIYTTLNIPRDGAALGYLVYTDINPMSLLSGQQMYKVNKMDNKSATNMLIPAKITVTAGAIVNITLYIGFNASIVGRLKSLLNSKQSTLPGRIRFIGESISENKIGCFVNNATVFGQNTKCSCEHGFAIGSNNVGSSGNLFEIGNATDLNVRNTCFSVSTTGQTSSATYTMPGADYAEMFEWEDGNPTNEDRIGLFVSVIGNKIRVSNENVIGVVSGSYGVLGSDPNSWKHKYMTDEFNRVIYDKSTDEHGNKILTPRLNELYDNSKEYIRRTDRKEWDAIGLMGQVYVKQDGTLKAGEYCSPSENGIAVKPIAGKPKYYIMEVISDKVVKVLFK